MHLRIALTLALIGSSAATPVTAEVLQPIENWDLDYGDAQCTAAHSFGASSSPVVLGIVPSLSGGTYQLLVSVPRKGPTYAHQLGGTLDFGRGRMNAPLLYYGGKGVNMSVYQARITAAQMEQARSATGVSLRSDKGDAYTFPVSDMPALLDGLAKCTANLQRYWNMDGKQTATPAVAVTGDIRSLITPSDYPAEAVVMHLQGTVQYQLLVDEKGTVAGCDVLVPSGVPTLDATGCEVIRHKARFTPALGRQGKPARSVVTTPTMDWTIGHDDAFDNSCTMMSGNTHEIVSMCGRSNPPPSIPSFLPPPPPPPPPPG